jgi:hypothetical protein
MYAEEYDLYDEKFNIWCILKGYSICTPQPRGKMLQVHT